MLRCFLGFIDFIVEPSLELMGDMLFRILSTLPDVPDSNVPTPTNNDSDGLLIHDDEKKKASSEQEGSKTPERRCKKTCFIFSF